MLDVLGSVPVQTLFLALGVFGFAPGAFLRLIVLAFERDDPRRHELLAELHAVPRVERPFWVAEQLEVAIFDGLGSRLHWDATGRIIYRWHLGSGVRMNRKYPDSFWIPADCEKQELRPGAHVRLIFEMSENWGRGRWGERMWVDVVEVKKRHIIGTLRNTPAGIPRLEPDDRIKFKRKHIIDIIWPDEEANSEVA